MGPWGRGREASVAWSVYLRPRQRMKVQLVRKMGGEKLGGTVSLVFWKFGVLRFGRWEVRNWLDG
jgi:hypothetical protein